MRVGIFGTFDVENYGDLLFPIIAERELEQRLENIEVVRYSYYKKDESSWCYSVNSLTDLLVDPTGQQSLDCVIIGGGHLIRFDKHVAYNYMPPVPQIPHPTGYWLAPALAGIFTGQPVLWNAPSASDEFPLWSHEIFRSVLEKSAYVSVRDQSSLKSLQRIGYDGGIVTADTIFSLANHFPRGDMQVRTEKLLHSIGLKKKYIVVQATPGVEPILRDLLANADLSSEFDLLSLPIGPILGDEISYTLQSFPQAKWFPTWPSPHEIAGLVAYSSGVVALSLHLSITALAYGLPVLRPKDTPINKYDLLRSSENVYFYDLSDLTIINSFQNALRSDEKHLCSLVKEAQSANRKHWDAIAEKCQNDEHRRKYRVNNFAKANFLLKRREKLSQAAYLEMSSQNSMFVPKAMDNPASWNLQSSRQSDTCVILHLFYPEMWNKILFYLSNFDSEFDLFITIPEHIDIPDSEIKKSFPFARIYRCENRGRDILPFLKIYSRIATLGYKYICKVHTKKSPQFGDGEHWNWDMWGKLLGSREIISNVKKAIDDNPRWGIIAPSGHLLPLMQGSHYWGGNQATVEELLLVCGFSFTDPIYLFSAGSMFWFKPEVFQLILDLGMTDSDFEPECGQLDATLAHALERFFGLLALKESYEIAESDSRGVKISEIPFHMVKLLKDYNDLELKVSDLSGQMSVLTAQVPQAELELNEIYQSKSWRLIQVLRRVRLFLIPVGSTREHLLRRVFQSVRSWRAGLRNHE